MAFLKFNKAELVNLSYSLKREIIYENKNGAYINTSIVTCNTRRYHGLLAVTLDRFGGDRFLLLSSIDEALVVEGKQFNLGIHCYGDVYEPRGHKYVVDFSADPNPQITYKVGEIVFRKTLLLDREKDQLLVKYELLESPAQAKVVFRPLLAFRNIHALTQANDVADKGYTEVANGAMFRLYESFPGLYMQFSKKPKFTSDPHWYYGVTYSDEYRRGFDCREDLLNPGSFELTMKAGDVVVLSAAVSEFEKPAELKSLFAKALRNMSEVKNYHDQLVHCADMLVTNHNGRMKINSGLSWMYTGLLRETLIALNGLTSCAGNPGDFEKILDVLIEDNKERFYSRTTQVEAPLLLATALQQYIGSGADEKAVYKKYGKLLKDVIESYTPGHREEVVMHPNGLLWAQKFATALSWMNAYVNGSPVTERAGYQVETNAYWYNAICFAIELDRKYGNKQFAKKWQPVADMIKANFVPTFWNERRACLADYVDGFGQNPDVRPNMLFAISVPYSPVDDELHPSILRVLDNELVTARGIRTLSPRDMKYKGVYEGSQIDRDLAYHQGSAHPWILYPYIETSFRVKGASFYKRAEWLIEGFYDDLSKHGVGSFSELYDGDPPFEAHGTIATALSTAALLSIEVLMNKYKEA